MVEHWPEILGVIVSLAGIAFFFLKWVSYQIEHSISEALKPLNEKIDRECATNHNETLNLEKKFDQESDKKDMAINAVGERLTKRIDVVSESVVYKDFFEQHAKLEDERYEAVKMLIGAVSENLKQSSTANTTEHNRICGKIDAMPTLIHEAVNSIRTR